MARAEFPDPRLSRRPPHPGYRPGLSPGAASPLSPPVGNLPIPQGSAQLSPRRPASQLTCTPLSSELLKRRVSPSGETRPGLFRCLLHLRNRDDKPLRHLSGGRAYSRFSVSTLAFKTPEQVGKRIWTKAYRFPGAAVTKHFYKLGTSNHRHLSFQVRRLEGQGPGVSSLGSSHGL